MKKRQVNKDKHRLQLGDCAQVEMKHIEADIKADLIAGGGAKGREEKKRGRKCPETTRRRQEQSESLNDTPTFSPCSTAFGHTHKHTHREEVHLRT